MQDHAVTFGERFVAIDLNAMRREDMGAAFGHQLPMRFAVDQRRDRGSASRGAVAADVIFPVILPEGRHARGVACVRERTIACNKRADRLDILEAGQPLCEVSRHALRTARHGGQRSCNRRD